MHTESCCSCAPLSFDPQCNNPLTKKPKLDVARELFPEWTAFDNEAKALDAEFDNSSLRASSQPQTPVELDAQSNKQAELDALNALRNVVI